MGGEMSRRKEASTGQIREMLFDLACLGGLCVGAMLLALAFGG